MKLLNVYRSEPSDDTKKLVEIVSEGRDFRGRPDHLLVVSKTFSAPAD